MLTRENVLKKNYINNCNGFDLKELSNIPKINLRGDYNDLEFVTKAGKILNSLIPKEPNTSNANNILKIIWLGPNEWLVEIYEGREFERIYSDLKNSLNSDNTAITDVTENRTILKLSGINIYKLLSKFIFIDFDNTLNKEYSVIQTLFVKIPVLIVKNNPIKSEQSVNIHVNRSHAEYLYNLLLDGSKNLNF